MTVRSRLRSLMWAMLVLMGCGGGCGGCGGSGCMASIPGGFPAAKRQSEAISVKLSASGLQSITDQVPGLVQELTNTTGSGYFQIPCIGPSNLTNLGGIIRYDAYICDTGDNQCRSTPPVAGQCTAGLNITGVTLGTQENNADGSVTVNVTIKAEVSTQIIPVAISGTLTVPIVGTQVPLGCAVHCDIAFDSTENMPDYIPIKMAAKLRVDRNYNNILTMSVDFPDFSSSLDTAELKVVRSGAPCQGSTSGINFNFGCDILNNNLVKQILFSQIQAQLTPALQDMVDGFRCLPCQTDADCPRTPQVSTCANDVCYVDQSNHICVPNPLGMEGRANVGSLLGSFGAPADAALDLSIIAGGRQSNDKPSLAANPQNSIQVGVMGGTRAPAPATCVPPATWTDVPTPPEMDFDAEARADGYTDYGIGISVSDPFIDKSLFDAWQSGMLCLNVGYENISLLTSGLLGGFLTNLDAVTHRENVPMLVALRPTKSPAMRIGKGTTKMENGKVVVDDPIITLSMNELHIDFYAFLEERYVRLFTVGTDLSVKLGLDFTTSSAGITSVNVMLGGISAPADKTICLNNHMNVVSDEDCKNFLPAVLDLVGSQLTSALPSIDLPAFSGIQLNVMGAKGSIATADRSAYTHLSLFAKLSAAPVGPEVAGVRTTAEITEAFLPSQPMPIDETTQPRVTIQAAANSPRPLDFAGYEYSYRVDSGAWGFWTPSSRFTVDSSTLRLPGYHDIEVRARIIGQPASVDTEGAHVYVPVDYSAPVVKLMVDPATGQLVTSAYDDATPTDQIAFRYSIGGAEWSAPETTRTIDLSSLGENAWVRVEASDLAGHTAVASYGSPTVIKSDWEGPARKAAPLKADTTGGCSAAGPSLLAVLGLAGLIGRRRSRRA